MLDQATTVLGATFAFSVPLVLAAAGVLVSDRSGVLALGMEGYMLIGAFAAVQGAYGFGPLLGLLCGAAAGAAVAALYAALAVGLRADQVICGLAVNVLALGVTAYANELLVGGGTTSFAVGVPGLDPLPVPGLSAVPVLGPALFRSHILGYAAVAAMAAVALVLDRTRLGLALRATGEHPLACEVRGIRVLPVRYGAVLTSGLLGGLAGTALSLGVVNTFVDDITAGRGFIAVAAVFLSGWRPRLVFGVCLLFGGADAVRLWAGGAGLAISPQAAATFPYLVTLAVLAAVRRRPQPAALGRPFWREQR